MPKYPLKNNETENNEINKEFKIEYIKSLIQNLNEQKKYVMLFISFNIFVMAFLVDKIILKELSPKYQFYLTYFIINVIFYFLSASFFTIWIDMIHRLSMKLLDLFITQEITDVRKTHYPQHGFWKKWRWIYIIAHSFLWMGILFTIFILFESNNFLL